MNRLLAQVEDGIVVADRLDFESALALLDDDGRGRPDPARPGVAGTDGSPASTSCAGATRQSRSPSRFRPSTIRRPSLRDESRRFRVHPEILLPASSCSWRGAPGAGRRDIPPARHRQQSGALTSACAAAWRRRRGSVPPDRTDRAPGAGTGAAGARPVKSRDRRAP